MRRSCRKTAPSEPRRHARTPRARLVGFRSRSPKGSPVGGASWRCASPGATRPPVHASVKRAERGLKPPRLESVPSSARDELARLALELYFERDTQRLLDRRTSRARTDAGREAKKGEQAAVKIYRMVVRRSRRTASTTSAVAATTATRRARARRTAGRSRRRRAAARKATGSASRTARRRSAPRPARRGPPRTSPPAGPC